ncbi:MAG: hypothetical protein HY073_05195 [Deltaproteobacteria bacterium]|nr:hypothetical protein [Deltaproteobacteria bacterium]
MSLKSFHKAFITISVLLGAGLIYLGLFRPEEFGLGNKNLLIISGGVLIGLLIPYFFWFRFKMKKLSALLMMLGLQGIILLPHPAWACAVCFKDPDSLLTKGIQSGVIALILCVGSVLGAIGGVAYSWSRKAKSIPPQL